MKQLIRLAGAFSLACAAAPALAQSYRDAGGTLVPGLAPLVGCTPTGNCSGPVSASNPLPVGVSSLPLPAGAATAALQPAINGDGGALAHITNTPGSTGGDFSANAPALPNVGSNFGSTGVYANYVLIKTIAASATRVNIDVENTSGAQIAIMRDDGTASSGSAPANASVFALSGGAQPGAQGGSWTSNTFKGRLQIYAASSTAFVAVMGD
jgi:hypothetical protein